MSDLERYGDYNEVDDDGADAGRVKKIVSLVIKILIAVAIAAVVGFFVFRIIIFNYYPASVSKMIYTDALAAFYHANGDSISVKTQANETQFDDPDEGNFWFDKVLIVPDADHLQVTLRYNTSLYASILEEYGIEIPKDADPAELFEFKLVRPIGVDADKDYDIPVEETGTLTATVTDSNLMYRYIKLAYDGLDVDFNAYREVDGHKECRDGDGDGQCDTCGLIPWLRIDIYIKGFDYEAYNAKMIAEGKVDSQKHPYMLAVYIGRTPLENYSLGKDEVPDK